MLSEREIEQLVRRAIDLHFHVGPDILPRKYTVPELIEAEEGRIAGIALKSHSFPTIGHILSATRARPTSLLLVGSVTLNYFMGGFNPSAVYASAVMSPGRPLIVWFPTVHAENHLRHNYSEYEVPPEWVKDPNFRPRRKTELKAIRVTDWNDTLFEKCRRVLRMMQRMGCILATGHLSWRESEVLATEALEMGMQVIITHPDQKDIAMPLRVQRELARRGAYIEYCYVMYRDRDREEDYPLDEMADRINEIGADHCILTSDAGQLHNPSSSESLKEFVRLLAEQGITFAQFEKMLCRNPRRILGLRE